MFRYFEIIGSSFKMALQEFRSNKLRTFLSLLGITFGIFCIISVLSTINSMEAAVQHDIQSLGSKTIYVHKWDYTSDGMWWKYIKRPIVKPEEMVLLLEKVPSISNAAYVLNTSDNMEYGDNILTNLNYNGISEGFKNIQTIDVSFGRYFQQSDFDRGANNIVIGNTLAEKLFVKPENAIGKVVRLKNEKVAVVVGVMKKQGQSLMQMMDYDNAIMMPYQFFKQMERAESTWDPIIMVQGKPDANVDELKDELTGAMRSIRKLKPTQEDNYSLNDIESFSKFMHDIFSNLSLGGWAITALSLIVGMFGVANIMFVTVRERTGQIGLKKAIGAKRGTIMMEFLLESAFLCIIGGLIGLFAVLILAQIFSAMFSFKVFVSAGTIAFAIGICLFVGVLAGIIPAYIAAKMDPVVAIRS